MMMETRIMLRCSGTTMCLAGAAVCLTGRCCVFDCSGGGGDIGRAEVVAAAKEVA
jgi:hypothetical protein